MARKRALKAAIAGLNNHHDWPEKPFVADCHTQEQRRAKVPPKSTSLVV
jgi:hypothetical protein